MLQNNQIESEKEEEEKKAKERNRSKMIDSNNPAQIK